MILLLDLLKHALLSFQFVFQLKFNENLWFYCWIYWNMRFFPFSL